MESILIWTALDTAWGIQMSRIMDLSHIFPIGVADYVLENCIYMMPRTHTIIKIYMYRTSVQGGFGFMFSIITPFLLHCVTNILHHFYEIDMG